MPDPDFPNVHHMVRTPRLANAAAHAREGWVVALASLQRFVWHGPPPGATEMWQRSP